MSENEQRKVLKAYRHALRHIESDDFSKHGDVGKIELEAHTKEPRQG